MNHCQQILIVQIVINLLAHINARIASGATSGVVHAVFPFTKMCPSIMCKCGMGISLNNQICLHTRWNQACAIIQVIALWISIHQTYLMMGMDLLMNMDGKNHSNKGLIRDHNLI